jgi:hypothetical protein
MELRKAGNMLTKTSPPLFLALFVAAAALGWAPGAQARGSSLGLPRPASPRGDRGCLRALERRRILFVSLGAGAPRAVRTPVAVVGPVGGVNLLPRAGRPPVMDCALALALADAGPIFRQLEVTGLSFSGAYDHRTRRRSRKLSAHAFGLAIDVHAVTTAVASVVVERDYPRDARRWEQPDPAACVGRPRMPGGRLLRTLACRLRAHRAFRVVLGPDDNADHHDHLHLETYPPGEPRLVASAP